MTRPATKPATALPVGTRIRVRCEVFPDAVGRVGNVVHVDPDQFRGIRVLLDATPHWVEHEHTFTPSEIERLSHPSESDSSRKAAGKKLYKAWLDATYTHKIKTLMRDSGFSFADLLRGWIDGEWAELRKSHGNLR